ncbi:MAG: hypothetical protein IH914_04405, partial [candidate division Zixibacteria bacterium]|nr:hypothetical protein [candidate division Zixibacteria bacterium]
MTTPETTQSTAPVVPVIGDSLGALSSGFSRIAGVRTLVEGLRRGDARSFEVSGLTGSARAFLLETLSQELSRPLLYLSSSSEDTFALVQDLERLSLSSGVYHFPSLSIKPYSFTLPAGETLGRRISSLSALASGKARVVVAPLAAVMEPTLSPACLQAETISLEVNSEIPLETVVDALIRLGFRRVSNVEEVGDFLIAHGFVFVFFVDDLERCRPPGSVNLLEIVNQLLRRVPPMPVVTVIMGDLDSIAADAEEKYKSKAERYQKERADSGISQGSDRGFGSNFLQKIIQLQFDLPDPPPDKVQTLVHQSVGEDEKDEGSETEGRSDLFERVVEAGHRLGDSLVMIFVGWLKAAWEADGGTGVLIRRLWHSRVGMADIFNLVSLIFLPFVWIARFCFDIAFPISRRRNVNCRPRVLSFRELKLFRPQSGLEFGARFKK